MRSGRAVRADGRRRALRQAHGRAEGALDCRRSREDRPDGAGSLPGSLSVPPRLSRQRPGTGLRLRAVGATRDRGPRANGVCARRQRSVASRGARAPVLAVLRLQRLEQPARRRLGNDPARLRRRERARRADDGSNECRLQPARRCRTRGLELLEARTGGRHAPGRLPRGRFTRELLRRRALPRQLRESGCRLRRHGRAAPRSALVGGERSQATRYRRASSFPGLRSRGAGASCNRLSSMARPAPI